MKHAWLLEAIEIATLRQQGLLESSDSSHPVITAESRIQRLQEREPETGQTAEGDVSIEHPTAKEQLNSAQQQMGQPEL